MPLQQPLLEPGTEVSRYRVEELIARGGMGLVYRARDIRLDRPVALKVLSPDLSDDDRFRQRFVRECRLAASLDHPHVVPVYEADDWHGLLYIAMRFVHGADLHTVLDGGVLDVRTTLRLLAQAASALDAAHEAGLVHRDVKPGNLMVVSAGRGHVPPDAHLYLTDFGLSKRASSVSGLTHTGTFLGSLYYVAPEQVRGAEVDGRADLYALACVAYEMLTGAPPFQRDQEAALLWAHMSVEPPLFTDVRPELPEAMAHVLARALAKDPADRPDTCGGFVAQLHGASGLGADPHRPVAASRTSAPPTVVNRSSGPTSPPGTTPPHSSTLAPATPPGDGPGGEGVAPRPTRRRRWVATTVVGVLLLVAAILVWRPWSPVHVDLETRSLIVIPYEAGVPAEWRLWRAPPDDGEYLYFAPPDRPGLVLDDPDSLAAGAEVAADEPERLVSMYVESAPGLADEAPEDLPGQILAGLPEGSEVRLTGSTLAGGLESAVLEGTLFLTEDQRLDLYYVLMPEGALIAFSAPTAIADQWQTVWDEILASVTPTG